jgi:hypothetical protein
MVVLKQTSAYVFSIARTSGSKVNEIFLFITIDATLARASFIESSGSNCFNPSYSVYSNTRIIITLYIAQWSIIY